MDHYYMFLFGLFVALLIVFIFRKELKRRRDAMIRFFRRRLGADASSARGGETDGARGNG